jgi:hypothetical protein
VAGQQPRCGPGQDGPVVLQFGGRGEPLDTGQDVLGGLPVNRVVDMGRRVEVAGAHRPATAVRGRLRRGKRQAGADPPAPGGLPVEAAEIRPQLRRLSGAAYGDPYRRGLHELARLAGQGGGALGPARSGPCAERAQRDPVPEDGIAPGRHRAPAQQPVVRRLPAGVGDIVLRGFLQVPGERIQAQPPGRGHVAGPDRPRGGKHPAAGRAGREPGPGGSLRARTRR